MNTTAASTEPVDFAGWVVVYQAGPDALLITDIEALPETDTVGCDTDHEVQRRAVYQLTNPENAEVLCQQCVQDLYRNASTRSDYVMGAVPAN